MIAKAWYWFGFLGSLSLIAVAYFYFEKHLGLAPCPLCMFQRAALLGVAFFCVFGLIFNLSKIWSKLAILGATIFSSIGLAIASRQVWLQHLPKDQVPECGPDLAFMLDVFPLSQVINTVLQGSGECAEVQWTLFSLSMPEWMVFVFGVMVLICLRLLFKRERNYFSGTLGR